MFYFHQTLVLATISSAGLLIETQPVSYKIHTKANKSHYMYLNVAKVETLRSEIIRYLLGRYSLYKAHPL